MIFHCVNITVAFVFKHAVKWFISDLHRLINLVYLFVNLIYLFSKRFDPLLFHRDICLFLVTHEVRLDIVEVRRWWGFRFGFSQGDITLGKSQSFCVLNSWHSWVISHSPLVSWLSCLFVLYCVHFWFKFIVCVEFYIIRVVYILWRLTDVKVWLWGALPGSISVVCVNKNLSVPCFFNFVFYIQVSWNGSWLRHFLCKFHPSPFLQRSHKVNELPTSCLPWVHHEDFIIESFSELPLIMVSHKLNSILSLFQIHDLPHDEPKG